MCCNLAQLGVTYCRYILETVSIKHPKKASKLIRNAEVWGSIPHCSTILRDKSPSP